MDIKPYSHNITLNLGMIDELNIEASRGKDIIKKYGLKRFLSHVRTVVFFTNKPQ